MATPSLVDTIHDLSRDLRRVASLLPDEDPLDPPPGKKGAAPFLFEIRVLVSLLRALKALGWSITIERRNGRVQLVRGPALKTTGSFFRISNASAAFQITQGTKIIDRYGHPRAPDIALQNALAAESPTFRDIEAIWDTKLRGETGQTSKKRVTDDEFRSFVMVRRWLNPPVPGKDALADWPTAFTVSALISNGLRPTEPLAILLDEKISVVEQFLGANSPTWPSRSEHVGVGAISSGSVASVPPDADSAVLGSA